MAFVHSCSENASSAFLLYLGTYSCDTQVFVGPYVSADKTAKLTSLQAFQEQSSLLFVSTHFADLPRASVQSHRLHLCRYLVLLLALKCLHVVAQCIIMCKFKLCIYIYISVLTKAAHVRMYLTK